MKTKKELRDEFRAIKPRAGIFSITCSSNGKVFLQTSNDLDRAFNSDLFQLKAGMHSNRQLQCDWNNYGAACFEFCIFDELKMNDGDTPAVIRKDLAELLEMHLTALRSDGKYVYNNEATKP